ncbi:gamma-glutamyltransferase family protein [Candidatus Hydrogenedentota bacterium]
MKPRNTQETDIERGPLNLRVSHPQRIGTSKHGMVSTAHVEATRAGVQMLEQGGNAIDAAVASAFALGVCEPAASGLGGQTAVLVNHVLKKKRVALDGSSRAPNRLEPGIFGKRDLLRGYKASTVPSTPATLAYLLREYGTLPLAETLKPAITLAERGFRVTPLLHSLMKKGQKKLKSRSAGLHFLKKGRSIYQIGDILRQPALARTLKGIAQAGVNDFYEGEIAKSIAEDMEKGEGLIRLDDLAQIPWPVERKPVMAKHGTVRYYTFPPPGAGRNLVQMLNVFDSLPERLKNMDTPKGALALAEIVRKAHLDRLSNPADPRLYHQQSKKPMIRSERAEKLAKRVLGKVENRGDTTHLSVMDSQGNAVALTQSIERVFGSFEASPELGFLYNNYMSAFEYEDMSHPYYLRPNAVPWASVAPTIAFRSGLKPSLVIGSPGSERIVSAVAQVILRLGQKTPLEAVSAPRLHCSSKGHISIEATRMRSDIVDALQAEGYEVDVLEPFSFYLGCVQLVMRERSGNLIGVADPRRDGSAAGPVMQP